MSIERQLRRARERTERGRLPPYVTEFDSSSLPLFALAKHLHGGAATTRSC